ncbi:MAG: N-acetylmuramoyl-L-alanine amidase [Acidimicrobiales bacterium]
MLLESVPPCPVAPERAGFATVLTRSGDHGRTLSNRARVAVGLEAEAFVSVHRNGGGVVESDTPGTETYHQVASAESKRRRGSSTRRSGRP